MTRFLTNTIRKPFSFRSKRSGPKKQEQTQHSQQQRDITTGNQQTAPVSSIPLKPVILPKVHPFHQLALSSQGWTTITYNTPSDPLQTLSTALFLASQKFFDLPEENKQIYRTQAGSEEGWSKIEGEKEFITLRTVGNTPDELKDAATSFWAEAGGLMNEILCRIAESLDLPAEALSVYSEPCSKLGEVKTATMLRLFRYEGYEEQEPKVVAEPHRDLGLLSLVIGDTPGLEVWDRYGRTWFPLEKSSSSPAASLLIGRQVETLTNGRYNSGGHLVRSYPDFHDSESLDHSKKFRYSIVFVLRAHSPVQVNTDELETDITGKFGKPLKDLTAGQLFSQIRGAHYNINTGLEERGEQKRKLAAGNFDGGY